MGFSKEEIMASLDEIIEFSDWEILLKNQLKRIQAACTLSWLFQSVQY